jgi:pre-rRNA-processing protein IPI1
VTSALSHIFPEIRVDAVKFVDILLDLVPEAVVDGWTSYGETNEQRAETSASGASQHGKRVIDGYLALLDLKSKPGGSVLIAISRLLAMC